MLQREPTPIDGRPSSEAEVPRHVALGLGWDGEGDPGTFLHDWRPAPDVEDPWTVTGKVFAAAVLAWLLPALLSRQGDQIVVLLLTVRTVDPLGGLLRWDAFLKERREVETYPHGDEMLAGVDLTIAFGCAPLLVIFQSETQSKGAVLGYGRQAAAA